VSFRHCERSEAIHGAERKLDCFASLAMTAKIFRRGCLKIESVVARGHDLRGLSAGWFGIGAALPRPVLHGVETSEARSWRVGACPGEATWRSRVRGSLNECDSRRVPLTRRFAPTSPRERGEVECVSVFEGGYFLQKPGRNRAAGSRIRARNGASGNAEVRAGSPDICAIVAFPIVPKTLYGAARLYHRQSWIIDQYQRLGGSSRLWRAV
jgi:hypothetical protein